MALLTSLHMLFVRSALSSAAMAVAIMAALLRAASVLVLIVLRSAGLAAFAPRFNVLLVGSTTTAAALLGSVVVLRLVGLGPAGLSALASGFHMLLVGSSTRAAVLCLIVVMIIVRIARRLSTNKIRQAFR
jgi:hypothetical protein